MIAWSSDMPDLRFVQTGSAILPHGAGSAGSHTKQARVGDTALHHPRATDCRNFETICERCGFFETGPQFLTILRRQHDHAADHNQPDPAQLFTEILESVAWTGTPPAGALAATPVAAEGEGLWPQFGQPVCHLGAVVHHPAAVILRP